MLEEEPAPKEDQTGNYIFRMFSSKEKQRRPNWKDPECSIEERNLFFQNLSGIEYGGAEEAKKDES